MPFDIKPQVDGRDYRCALDWGFMSPPRGLHLKSPPETAVRKHTGKGCNVSTALVAAARRCIPRAVVVADPEDGERWTCLPKVRATDAHADWCIANGLPALLALCRGNSAACLRVAVGRCHQSPLPDSSPLVQHLRGGGWCDGGCAARCKGPGDQPRRGLATANLIASKSPVRGRATDSSPCPMHCAGRIVQVRRLNGLRHACAPSCKTLFVPWEGPRLVKAPISASSIRLKLKTASQGHTPGPHRGIFFVPSDTGEFQDAIPSPSCLKSSMR